MSPRVVKIAEESDDLATNMIRYEYKTTTFEQSFQMSLFSFSDHFIISDQALN